MAPNIILCGLYMVDASDCVISSSPIPLRGVHAEAKIVDMVVETTITQHYTNVEHVPIEAKYVFPLDDRAAVCEFEAEIDGKIVVGEVKEKEQARREYTDAIAKGDGAYLLEQHRADVFSIKVGNLPPGKSVAVRITYISELKVEDDAVRFLLPTHVAPRYTPFTYGQEPIPNTSIVVPAYHSPYFTRFASLPYGLPYGLSFKLSCEMRTNIVSISSPTHTVAVTQTATQASVELASGLTQLNGDLIVLIKTENPHEPRVCLEQDPTSKSRAMMITLVPHFEFPDVKTELIFVIDRSGSMQGSQIAQARSAMQLFLKSVPVDSYFNIVGFGSTFQVLFSGKSVPYNEQNLSKALNHCSSMQADLQGTEILKPLQAISNMPLIPGYPRQLFVLTDGQVSNTEQVVGHIRSNNVNTRVFALGIGSGVSHDLVEGMARAGKGNAQFVVDGERMESKVIRQLKDAVQPALTNVKVDWGVDEEKIIEQSTPKVKSLLGYRSSELTDRPLRQAPFTVPPVFDGTRFLIFAFIKPDIPAPSKVSIKAESPDGPLTVDLELKEDECFDGNIIHRMAARTMIRDLEEGSSWMHLTNNIRGFKRATDDVVKNEIIRLGKTYSLASKHTSFIAVEKRDHSQTNSSSSWFGESVVYTPIATRPVPSVQNTSTPLRYRQSSSGRGGASVAYAPPPAASAAYAPSAGVVSAPPPPSGGFFGSLGGMLGFSGSAPPVATSMSRSVAAHPPPPAAVQYDSSSAQKSKKRSVAPARKEKESCDMSSDTDEMMKCEEDISVAESLSTSLCDMSTSLSRDSIIQQSKRLDSRPEEQERKPSNTSNSSSTLSALVAAQKLDGSYELNSALSSIIGVSTDKIANLGSKLSLSMELVATACAIAFFQLRLSSFQDEFELIVQKAKSWIARSLKSSGATIDSGVLLREAAALL